MRKKRKFLIAGVILFLALSYLGYTAFAGAATYYYTVSEFAAQGRAIDGETVRINGLVALDSVKQEAQGTKLSFTVVDANGKESLPVVYQGVVPDTFKAGNEIVVEGHLNADGVFQAHVLMPKCPSRYEPE